MNVKFVLLLLTIFSYAQEHYKSTCLHWRGYLQSECYRN